MSNWIAGLEAVFAWQSLLFMIVGIVGGIAVGAIPGLTATMAIAIMLPFTFVIDPIPGMMMLLGIYSSAVYAGSIPAILMRLPGTPASAATALDGYPMAQAGKGGQALMISLVSSVGGALVGGFLLAAFAPLLASVALQFGPAEYFMLAMFALAIIASMSEGAMVKGLISGLLGLLIATVGIDPIDGYTRFAFGQSELRAGIGFIPVLIGLFGVAEALIQYERRGDLGVTGRVKLGSFRLNGVLRRLTIGGLYSSLIGFFVGVLPGTGGDIAAFVGHNEVRRISRNNQDFGRGDPRGLAAAESANNAAVPGTVAPTLVLGIPGNSAAAVLIGAITVHGLRPGPQLFTGAPDLVYGIFVGLIVIPFLMLGIGLLGIRFWGAVSQVPTGYLWPVILVLSVIGSYALRTNMVDVVVMIGTGVLGYMMVKVGLPPAPLVIGLIVGPIAEAGFRRATIISGGSYSWVLDPLPFVLLVLSCLTFGLSLYRSFHNKDSTPKKTQEKA